MEENFGDLLEELDKVPHGNSITVKDLIKKWSHPDVTQKLINEAWKRELIADKDCPLKNVPLLTVPTNISLILTIKGFEFLNQIRIKQAIDQLNNSSDESYKKMIELTGKLGISVDNLYKSSGRIEDYNKCIIILTAFLALLTVVLIYLTILTITKSV